VVSVPHVRFAALPYHARSLLTRILHSIASLIATLWITEIVRSEFTSFFDMILFSAVYVPYLILQGTMGMFALAEENNITFANLIHRHLWTFP
jgi:hypothetical protein